MKKKLLLIPIGVIALAALWVLALTLTSGSLIASGEGNLTTSSPKVTDGGASWSGISDSRAIVWDNGMAYDAMASTQYDNVYPFESIIADDFEFTVDQLVNDVHWIGGYWNGPPDDGDFDWEVIFYNDDGSGSVPGTEIATYYIANADVNETLIAAGYFSYSVNLSSTLSFLAGTRYWISIQGIGVYPPQSGWAYHTDPILLSEGVFKSDFFGWPDWTGSTIAWGEPYDFCFQLTYEEECIWNEGDDHKMHFPQLPDEAGWDVMATYPMVLADDFECAETGWIKDFHWWGSWRDDFIGEDQFFILSIHEDIPADVNPDGYSKPGVTLWEVEFSIDQINVIGIDPPTSEGWYDPSTGEALPDNHQSYFQYNLCLDEALWFPQDSGVIYWLNIMAFVQDPGTQWGWKSTLDHWNDDAVWAIYGDFDWKEIYEPGGGPDPITNNFWIEFDATGMPVQATTGGTDYYDDPTSIHGWFFYPNTGWWNIWFYDHPFDPTRYKEIYITFNWYPTDEQYWIEVALNWATDFWEPGMPPPIPPLDPTEEEMYIYREYIPIGAPGEPVAFNFTIPTYNPEWVSIDIMGANVAIVEGIIVHECLPQQGVSLDLAFVITGEAPVPDSGACCYPEPTGSGDWLCLYTEEDECINVLGGVWEGVGTQCLGMEACCLPVGDPLGDCVNADALCCVNELGGTPMGPGTACGATEACCFGTGACEDLDPLCCVLLGGVPQGPGSACSAATQACCLADDQCADMDPLCCVMLGGTPQGPGSQCGGALEACCLPNGNCANLDPICCLNLGGVPQGQGTNCTVPAACCIGDDCFMYDPLCCDDMGGTLSPWGAPNCLGDQNGNSIDDACEMPEDLKWYQPPDLEPTGMDVMASEYSLLADDFLCDRTGPITEIHVWGSWLYDEMPNWDPWAVNFTLSIHADIPVGPFGWSIPGELLWIRDFQAGEFEVIPYAFGLEEGWYDPEQGLYLPIGDTQCWEYIFYLADDEFIQLGSESEPIVYWLDLFATPIEPGYSFGWKTSREHWNDDAVWSFPPDPPPPDMWTELRYPMGHPFEMQSIDLAFAIYGPAACNVIIGDADNSGGGAPIDIDDVVYLIAYIFSSGPPPMPYPVASGDADCKGCAVDIDDVVYLIAYIFSGGPPPCTCEEWVALCGALH